MELRTASLVIIGLAVVRGIVMALQALTGKRIVRGQSQSRGQAHGDAMWVSLSEKGSSRRVSVQVPQGQLDTVLNDWMTPQTPENDRMRYIQGSFGELIEH